MKRFWELRQQANFRDTLDLYIYSAIEADYYDWWSGEKVKSETSAESFREELSKYPDVKNINIYVNSLGGSVVEGNAIYAQLRRHPATVTAYVDGFACSEASVVCMAADKVVMPKNAVMMIHNMWITLSGNANELRKAADDLDTLNKAARQAYLTKSAGKITEDKLCELLDNETYLTAEECMEYGFADEYAEKEVNIEAAKQMLASAKEAGAKQYANRVEKVCALADSIPESTPKPHEPAPDKNAELAESFMKFFK